MTTDDTRARKLRWIALLAAILIALPLALWINARGSREVQPAVVRDESPRAEPATLERAGLLESSAREAETPVVASASDVAADAEPQARVLALRLRAQAGGTPLAGLTYVKRLDYDALAKAQEKAANKLRRSWYNASAQPKDKFEAALGALPDCFLHEGLPHDLASSVEAWQRDAKQHGLDKKSLQAWPAFEAWKSGSAEGKRAYEELWKRWR